MNQVQREIGEILNLDREKILRPSYGETSLKNFEDELNSILYKLEFISKYAPSVDESTNSGISGQLGQLKSQLNTLIGYDQASFVSNKNQIVTNVRNHYNEIKRNWPQYACAALEETGLLSNANLQTEFKEIADRLKNSTDEALKKIEIESAEIIQQATKKAEEIENSVRKTAQKISVQEAQEQFQKAADHNIRQIIIWGSISGLLIVILTIYLIYLFNAELPDTWTWQILYYSIIRLTLLTLISTLLAFGLKILKSQLHLHQHNLHRQRLANSMSSFVESATSKEQRDIILAQLINAVSTFGTTGLVAGDDDNKIVVDNISRTIETVRGLKE